MKIFFLLLLCLFIISRSVATELKEHDPDDSMKPPEIVNMDVLCEEPDETLRVHVSLVPTETFLANENVPVWITLQSSEPTDSQLISLDIMKKLSPFTVYRDPDTCSAALYFHETKQFEGTIGHHHVIRKLNYEPETKVVEPSEDTILVSPLLKHYQRKVMANIVSAPVRDRVKSLGTYPETVYLEVLVMVNNDITEDLQKDYASIVTYVLTLFNTVDMLFSKIARPNIKINIAGIIIATEPFPQFTAECYDNVERINDRTTFMLRDHQAFKAIERTLEDIKFHVPLQSYDIVVFLIRSPIIPSQSRGSVTYGVSAAPRTSYKRWIADVGVAIVSDPKNLQRFPTVAHEIAHLLGAPHDGGPLFTEDGTCDANLMRSPGSRCSKCIKFGGKTPEYLKTFFGTRDACIFHNKPRSLNDPRYQQLFWEPSEQCECYGFESVYNRRNCCQIPFFSPPLVNCKFILKCVNESDSHPYHYTNFHMDGTPCARNWRGTSVCWNQECVRLQNNVGGELHE